jgi:hypothetical protein
VPSTVRRRSSILAALFAAGVLASVGFVVPGATAAKAGPVPKVVLIVGPSGSATNGYRAEARAAAAVARRYTPDVTELYSPNATWTAVKAALQNASLVVYMGHGNGWPSPYRDSLYPPTQDGFGLNPSVGGGDDQHQYYGEGRIAASVHLAKDAVVLLHHLCYASGLSEPGLPEGTLGVAEQRVDNFASGFIAAGASAVIAEAYASPSNYVRAILGSSRSIDATWRSAPSANGNAFAFESARNPGFVAQMDPESASHGFERSVVLKAGLVPADVRAGARGTAGATRFIDPGPSSLAGTGISFAAPRFSVATTAGTTTKLSLPFKIDDRGRLPAAVAASLRWDRIDTTVTGPPDPTPSPTPPVPPSSGLALVTPETPGQVVSPDDLTIGKTAMFLSAALPTTPGHYRLTVTLHDGDGLAYDAATQAMLPTVIVRVTGTLDGAIAAAPTATFAAGTDVALPIRVANLGASPWGHAATDGDPVPASAASIVGRWLPLDLTAPAVPLDVSTDLAPGLAPNQPADATIPLTIPSTPGDYLLVLDIVTPDHGSLAAAGIAPTIVRIHVVDAPAGPAGNPGGTTARKSTSGGDAAP